MNLLRIWTGPLPKEELYPKSGIKSPVKHWLLHPLKRHLSRNYLKFLKKFFGLQVIAIGGSNGKTTTRTLLHTLLSTYGQTVSTLDSVTSTYNIPTSILKCSPTTKYFICEMSVEYIGDMDFYLWLAKPNIAIITLIDLEHTQFFGNLEAVQTEELKLAKGKWPKIVNGNSSLIPYKNLTLTETFGTSNVFTAFIKQASLTPDLSTEIAIEIAGQTYSYELSLPNKILAHSLAACLLTLKKLSLPFDHVESALKNLKPAPHRFTPLHTKSHGLIIDDSYNANPSSTQSSIETAAGIAKLTHRQLVIVLSQMNELGDFEISEHQKIGNLIHQIKPKALFCIGPASNTVIKTSHMGELLDDKFALIKKLNPYLNSNYLILFKSSRGWKLEEVIGKIVTQ